MSLQWTTTGRSWRRAPWRGARWKRCWPFPALRAAARCCSTTIPVACWSPRNPTSPWPRGCTMQASGSQLSITKPPPFTWSSRCRALRRISCSTPRRSPTCLAPTDRLPMCSVSSRTGQASATWRPTWRIPTTMVASQYSKPAPGWENLSPISSRPSSGPGSTTSARSSRPTRSTFRSS